MIDWKKYFDRIYCIRYAGRGPLDLKSDKDPYINELRRVGILDSGIFDIEYSVDSLAVEIFHENHPGEFDKQNLYGHHLHVTFTHYIAALKAYTLGYNRILIIEDDICWLKDLNMIDKYLSSIPEDDKYNICLFDWAIETCNWDANENCHLDDPYIDDNNLYREFKHGCLSSCYALNRKGMEHIITCIEKGPYYVIDMILQKYHFTIWDVIDETKPHTWDNLYYSGDGYPSLNSPEHNPIFSTLRLCIQTADNWSKPLDYDRITLGQWLDFDPSLVIPDISLYNFIPNKQERDSN